MDERLKILNNIVEITKDNITNILTVTDSFIAYPKNK